MSIDFGEASDLAIKNAKKLLPRAKDFTLEGIMIEKGNYEVSLSYFIDGEDPLNKQTSDRQSLGALLKIMGRRREEKIFIISKSGEFKGFKNIQSKF